MFYSDNFLLSQHSTLILFMKKIFPYNQSKQMHLIVLNNIFFDVNKFDLKPESQVELDKIIQLLNDNPTSKNSNSADIQIM